MKHVKLFLREFSTSSQHFRHKSTGHIHFSFHLVRLFGAKTQCLPLKEPRLFLALFCSKQCASFKNVPSNCPQVYLHTLLTTSPDRLLSNRVLANLSNKTFFSDNFHAPKAEMETSASRKETFEVTSRHKPITSAIVTKDHLWLPGEEWPFVKRHCLSMTVMRWRLIEQKTSDIFWKLRVF